MRYKKWQLYTYLHLQIKNNTFCKLAPKFDTFPSSGVNGMIDDPEKVIFTTMKKIVHTFPEEIKKILKNQEIWADTWFNAKEEIFFIYFYIRKTANPTFLTDAQWLKIYHIIQTQKLDISKFELLDNFEWGMRGPFPISKYLRETDKKND